MRLNERLWFLTSDVKNASRKLFDGIHSFAVKAKITITEWPKRAEARAQQREEGFVIRAGKATFVPYFNDSNLSNR